MPRVFGISEIAAGVANTHANIRAEPFNRAPLSSYAAIAIYIPGLFGGLKARAVINDVPGPVPGKFYGHDRCN